MRGFEKRQLEREAKLAREAEEWHAARVSFRQGLALAGVSFSPLVTEVRAEHPWFGAELLTWWRREEVAERAAKVRKAIDADYITHTMLHGGIAAPAESRTVEMWIDAQAAGEDVLDAALLLTALRSTESRSDLRREPCVAEFRDQLFGWSWDALKAHSIDPYSLSRVWFLPELLDTDRCARDKDHLIEVISSNMAAFLLQWTPVRVTVHCPALSSIELIGKDA